MYLPKIIFLKTFDCPCSPDERTNLQNVVCFLFGQELQHYQAAFISLQFKNQIFLHCFLNRSSSTDTRNLGIFDQKIWYRLMYSLWPKTYSYYLCSTWEPGSPFTNTTIGYLVHGNMSVGSNILTGAMKFSARGTNTYFCSGNFLLNSFCLISSFDLKV